MRALLVAGATDRDDDFWVAFDGATDLTGVTVADPFMGGGTTLVEAARLGATTRGVDIDPVACAVASFQLDAAGAGDLASPLAELKRDVGSAVRPLHAITGPAGEAREVVHWFWVQLVPCQACGLEIEAHPHFKLATDESTRTQTVFCSNCHAIETTSSEAAELGCRECGTRTVVAAGPVRMGRLRCPSCATDQRLIDLAPRTRKPPVWRLFASESIVQDADRRRATMASRLFLPVGEPEQALYAKAESLVRARSDSSGAVRGVPTAQLPTGIRADDRLRRYGYRAFADLFNQRQLLHLSLLSEALSTRSAEERRSLGLAYSDHLATNCMLTGYAFGWRRLSPLFAVRGYRHVVRPVEVNPWLDGIGRGTFPNAVRQVQRAIDEARRPRTLARAGGFTTLPKRQAPKAEVVCADARDLGHIESASVDLILTDPPYLDNVAYSELADFYRPWLRQLGLAPEAAGLGESLAVRARDEQAQAHFEAGLREVMVELERILAPRGRITFTFRHESPRAYAALQAAIAAAGLRAVTVFPLKGDGDFGLHSHPGSTSWDAVFVLARGERDGGANGADARQAAARWADHWTTRLRGDGIEFGRADASALLRAALTGAALGAFGAQDEADDHLWGSR